MYSRVCQTIFLFQINDDEVNQADRVKSGTWCAPRNYLWLLLILPYIDDLTHKLFSVIFRL